MLAIPRRHQLVGEDEVLDATSERRSQLVREKAAKGVPFRPLREARRELPWRVQSARPFPSHQTRTRFRGESPCAVIPVGRRDKMHNPHGPLGTFGSVIAQSPRWSPSVHSLPCDVRQMAAGPRIMDSLHHEINCDGMASARESSFRRSLLRKSASEWFDSGSSLVDCSRLHRALRSALRGSALPSKRLQ